MRTRTVALFLIAAQLLLAGCDRTPSRPETAPSPKPPRAHAGYYVQMPPTATASSIESIGGALLNVTSNLPDGTLAYITSDTPGQNYSSMAPIRVFVDGTLKLRQPHYCAAGPDKDLFTRGFNVQIIVLPDISLIRRSNGDKPCKSLLDCGAGPLQPRSVQEILGRNFERLTGDSVTTIFGTPALLASAHYPWPKGGCRASLPLTSGAPRTCPPSTSSINEEEGGANGEEVIQSMAILLKQNRICDVYSFTTERFRKAESWPQFRERVKRWTKLRAAYAMGGIVVSRGPNKVGVLQSSTFLEVRYVLWGDRVARARYVAQRLPSGYTKWQIEAIDLYEPR